MKKIFLTLAALCMGAAAVSAQDIVLTPADSVYIERTKVINDYSLIGVQYGAALSSVSFDPNRDTEMQLVPVNVGVTYTRYGKMFGYMPYFGIQAGVFYTRDAYKFKTNEKTGVTDYILGASKAVIQNIEVPVLAHLHFDFWKMKVLLNVGPFLGYRLSIARSDYHYKQPEDIMQYQNKFHPNERRFDYGIKAGGGFAFVFDPIEIHLTAAYKYSLSYLHQPDVNRRTMEHDDKSKTYYNWSYPTNIIISLGIHYQLTNRIGLTKKQIRRQAASDVRELYKEAVEAVEAEQRAKQEEELKRQEEAAKAKEAKKAVKKDNVLDQSFKPEPKPETKPEVQTETGEETEIRKANPVRKPIEVPAEKIQAVEKE